MRSKLNEDEIEIYFALKLLNSLTETELSTLNEIIEEDPVLKARWVEFCKYYSENDKANHFKRFEDENLWKPLNIVEQETKNQHVRPSFLFRLPKRGIVALVSTAAVVAVILLIYQGSYFTIPTPKLAINKTTIKGARNVYLVLSDGRKISLNEDQGNFEHYGIQFEQQEGLFSMKAPAGINGINQLIVPAGKNFNLKLEDGSVVQINSNTTVSLPMAFSHSKREIWINGEAYIKVAKDADRTFVVHTKNGDIQVLGTEFNVNTYDPGHTRVSLVSGSVRIATAKKQLLMKAGATAITSDNKDILLQNVSPNRELAWKEGRYFFQNSGLAEIKEVLERWYGVHITVENSSLRDLRFTGGVNKKEDIKIFLDNLSAVTNLKYQQNSEEIILH